MSNSIKICTNKVYEIKTEFINKKHNSIRIKVISDNEKSGFSQIKFRQQPKQKKKNIEITNINNISERSYRLCETLRLLANPTKLAFLLKQHEIVDYTDMLLECSFASIQKVIEFLDSIAEQEDKIIELINNIKNCLLPWKTLRDKIAVHHDSKDWQEFIQSLNLKNGVWVSKEAEKVMKLNSMPWILFIAKKYNVYKGDDIVLLTKKVMDDLQKVDHYLFGLYKYWYNIFPVFNYDTGELYYKD